MSGSLGKIDEDVLINWDIKQKNVFFAQINLEELRRFCSPRQPYRSVSEYPAIVRDVSLAVKTSVYFQQVCAMAFRMGGGILNSVKFNEEYRGEKIPAGQRGIVFLAALQGPRPDLARRGSQRGPREDPSRLCFRAWGYSALNSYFHSQNYFFGNLVLCYNIFSFTLGFTPCGAR